MRRRLIRIAVALAGVVMLLGSQAAAGVFAGTITVEPDPVAAGEPVTITFTSQCYTHDDVANGAVTNGDLMYKISGTVTDPDGNSFEFSIEDNKDPEAVLLFTSTQVAGTYTVEAQCDNNDDVVVVHPGNESATTTALVGTFESTEFTVEPVATEAEPVAQADVVEATPTFTG